VEKVTHYSDKNTFTIPNNNHSISSLKSIKITRNRVIFPVLVCVILELTKTLVLVYLGLNVAGSTIPSVEYEHTRFISP